MDKPSNFSKKFGELVASLREKNGFSLEKLAAISGLHRTTIGLIEKGKRKPTLEIALALSKGLEYSFSDLIKIAESNSIDSELTFHRRTSDEYCRNESKLYELTGLDFQMLIETINHCYRTLDIIDFELIQNYSPRIADLVELANLSSIIGNLLGSGIASASNGLYIRNKPHTYPDLIPNKQEAKNLELKVALETNKPKGHLPKAGYYITFRYVLTDNNGKFIKGKENRGLIPTIWEVKVGYINESDFAISNTSGDSGKTAIINSVKFNSMPLVYFVPEILPYKKGKDLIYPGFN